MNISGNAVFIPGATSGIGRGLAERFADAGNKVIVAGRRRHLVEEIVAGHDNIEGFVLDVTDPRSIDAAVSTIKTAFPETNVLITVAGIMLPEDIHTDAFLPTSEATITTNLLGPIRLIGALTEFLAAKDEAAILTVSSGLAFVPRPDTPTYSATKAAMHSFTESLRIQLSNTNLQVIEIVPPAVRTALMNQQNAEHAMPLDDFLSEAMELLESEPDADEILVENVKFLRYAEANGKYDEVLGRLSALA
jgi:uncharacterized oxidoreductase